MPDHPEANPSLHRAENWLALALLAVLAALNLYSFLHRGGFWRDEVDLINLSAVNPLKHLGHDSFPVLMSLVIHKWQLLFGASDLALRSLGLVIGLGVTAALWFAGQTLRHSAPLLGLALFGLSSTVLAYDQAMRGYGLGSLLIITFLATMWLFLQKPSTTRLLLLLLLAVLSVQTLFQNAVLVAAISVGAWAVCLKRNQRATAFKIGFVGLLAAISLKPYLGGIASAHQYAVATADVAPRRWADFLPLADLMSFPFREYSYVWAVLILAVICGGVLQLRVNLRKNETVPPTDATLFGGVTVLASLVGFVIFFKLTGGTHIQPWHFLPLLAVLAALVDFIFDLFPTAAAAPAALRVPRLARTILFGVILATALIGTAFAQRNLQVRFSNLDLIAARLTADAKARDYILVTPWYCGITYNRYHQSTAPWDTLPPITNHWLHHYDLVQPYMGDSNATRSVEQKISTVLQRGGRVWVAGQLLLPSPDRQRRADLPAPPLKDTGFDDTPYNLVWSWQIEYFLTTHATNFGTANLPTNNYFSENENLTLVYADGWRTNSLTMANNNQIAPVSTNAAGRFPLSAPSEGGERAGVR